jgi:hypothetical protein
LFRQVLKIEGGIAVNLESNEEKRKCHLHSIKESSSLVNPTQESSSIFPKLQPSNRRAEKIYKWRASEEKRTY